MGIIITILSISNIILCYCVYLANKDRQELFSAFIDYKMDTNFKLERMREKHNDLTKVLGYKEEIVSMKSCGDFEIKKSIGKSLILRQKIKVL